MISAPVRPDDAALLRRLHEEHSAALWTFAVRMLGGDEATAQDVVQETFLRAWQHPAALDPRSGSVRGWLFTVARHLIIDQRRREHRHPEVVTPELPEPGNQRDLATGVADRELVLAALRMLSIDHRKVLVECYFRGSSVAQAAQRLGVAEGTVKSRTHYALLGLRSALEELGWSP